MKNKFHKRCCGTFVSGRLTVAPRPRVGRVLDDPPRKDYLVDPASNHMLVSKIKPCMSKYMPK